MTEAEVSQFTSMRVEALRPSPDNPRKHIDAATLEQLAENIKEHGVISPLVIRPIFPTNAGGVPIPSAHATEFEIVSGERRWRASKMAGLERVPVRILQLSDAAALEIQVIENLQRSDIHELEEADGYKALQDRYGYTVEDLAAKVGKSVAYIYGRLRLCHLVDATAREAFFSRAIAPTVALFISRLAPKQQGEAARMVLTDGWDDEANKKGPMNTGRALQQLRQKYTLKLADAPFSTESEELVLAAGPCTTCPKRSGNAPTLFATETPDVCTDAPCYTAKTKRHFAILVEDAKASGRTVIEGKKAKEIFPWDTAASLAAGWVLPSSCEWTADGKQERTWKERLGEHMPVPTLVVHPKTREVIEVITLAELKAAKKAAGIKPSFDDRDSGPRKSAVASEERKKAEREDAKRKERVERAKSVGAAAVDMVCGLVATASGENGKKALAFALAAHPSGRIAMVDEKILPEKDRGFAFEYDRTVAKAALNLEPRQLVALLVRASVYGIDDRGGLGFHPFTGEYTAELKALAGFFDKEVSLKDLEKKATGARLIADAVAEQAKKVDAALAVSGKKSKPAAKAPAKLSPSAPKTAMAAALLNAKPAKVKKAPTKKAKASK